MHTPESAPQRRPPSFLRVVIHLLLPRYGYMGNTPILDIAWQGHGSGSSPSQTSSPDDVRYPAYLAYLHTYILVPYLLWMDSTGIGTDIYLRPMKRVESRWWGEKMREDEEEEEEETRENRTKQTTIRPPQSFFFLLFKRYARGGGKRRIEQEKAKKGILYIPYRPPSKISPITRQASSMS